jgi:hypothetical protein
MKQVIGVGNRVFRRIFVFVPKREVTENCTVPSALDIGRMIKSRILTSTEQAVHMGRLRNGPDIV